MAPKKKQEVLEEIDDLDDDIVLEELSDEPEETEDEADEGNDEDALSAKEAAKRIGTDGRTLRKFLRSQRGLVGQGNRWAIMEDELDDLKAKFEDWQKPKAAKTVKVTIPPDDEDADEIEDLDELIDD